MAVPDLCPGEISGPSIRWEDGTLSLLDQTQLPALEQWLRCEHPEQVAEAISQLAVRGAPAIGIAAAFGLALIGAEPARGEAALRARVDGVMALLAATRPTAVELRATLNAARAELIRALPRGQAAAKAALVAYAERLWERQRNAMRALVDHGAPLLEAGDRVLTHCNTGAIATGGQHGTALGILEAAHRAVGLKIVWVSETRPLLQGARLTAWELDSADVPYRIVTDSSAGALMARGLVDAVVVGSDRIAANGDVANKIGTYALAVLADHHEVPFIVAAPRSTFDLTLSSGREIPIEERSEGEVTEFAGRRVAPPGAQALNLAFDVTPADLIGAIATDVGVLRAPFGAAIADAIGGADTARSLAGGVAH